MNNSQLKTASVLAFERKFGNSDGFMYSGNWKDRTNQGLWKPVLIQSKDVRGTISNRLKSTIASDPLKLDAEIQKANLQRVDVASLPFEQDTLKVSFTLKVLGNLEIPSACNSPAYQNALGLKIAQYREKTDFRELSFRYAENIANARFLWRNRIGSEAIEVQVKQIKDQIAVQTWTFDALEFNVRTFSGSNQLSGLAEVIREALAGDSFAFIAVDAFVRLGKGQEVFPSQELVLDKTNSKDTKSKFLYSVNDVAAMHSQKIGNALRTIDTWYPEAAEFGPISVEPYGSVTNRGTAYRQPKDKIDFYSLLDGWIVKDKEPELEQQHYVIAGLVRGGVYGEKE